MLKNQPMKSESVQPSRVTVGGTLEDLKWALETHQTPNVCTWTLMSTSGIYRDITEEVSVRPYIWMCSRTDCWPPIGRGTTLVQESVYCSVADQKDEGWCSSAETDGGAGRNLAADQMLAETGGKGRMAASLSVRETWSKGSGNLWWLTFE